MNGATTFYRRSLIIFTALLYDGKSVHYVLLGQVTTLATLLNWSLICFILEMIIYVNQEAFFKSKLLLCGEEGSPQNKRVRTYAINNKHFQLSPPPAPRHCPLLWTTPTEGKNSWARDQTHATAVTMLDPQPAEPQGNLHLSAYQFPDVPGSKNDHLLRSLYGLVRVK